MGAAPVVKVSVEEYLAADRAAEFPSEYYDGEVFPIAVANVPHSLINNNFVRRVAERLDGGPCHILAQIRVRIGPAKFVYPDQAVVCGRLEFIGEGAETIANPKVVVEVMSPSTSDYDHGGKFALYRRLPSLEDYVLIAQDQPSVEVFHKTADGAWLLNTHEGLDAVAKIDSLRIALPLNELYAGIEVAAP